MPYRVFYNIFLNLEIILKMPNPENIKRKRSVRIFIIILVRSNRGITCFMGVKEKKEGARRKALVNQIRLLL